MTTTRTRSQTPTKRNAAAPNHTTAISTTAAKPSTTMLTDHKLTLYESEPVEMMDVEYKDFLMAKNQWSELNMNWKRVREDEPENLEEWIQNKRSNMGNGMVELTPLNAALRQAGMLIEDIQLADEFSQSTVASNTRSSSGNYNFRSRSSTRATSSGTSTPISTPENVDTASTKKDVESLNVTKDRKRRSASRACSSRSSELSVVTLIALLDSADNQASSKTAAPSPKGMLHQGQLDPEDLQISDTVLGEGQLGMVRLGFYKGLYVACKSKRPFTRTDAFHSQAKREMMFAAKLAACRYINRYIGWISCRRELVERASFYSKHTPSLYIVQRYVPNGDARGYLEKRGKHLSW